MSDGLIMCRPRNGEAPQPWLPEGSPLAPLVISQIHARLGHLGSPTTIAEVRRSHWLPRARRLVRRVLSSCPICKRFKSRPMVTAEGSLPEFRVNPSRPYAYTGLDHCGPLMLPDGSKRWILLFTCGVIRAVHLELVAHLDVEATSQALRRFVARYGKPRLFLSDNGTSFVALARVLRPIQPWFLIPEGAPWWGGFWERAVGTVKSAIRCTLGKSSLGESELITVLAELQDSVNRRPLVMDEEGTLSPAHFLFGGEPPALASSFVSTELPPDGSDYASRLRHRHAVSERLWQKWRSSYLQSLRNWRRPSRAPSPLLGPGDVVLLAPPDGIKIPRTQWRLGKVLQPIIGRDGHIRAAHLLVGGRETRRPLSKLYLLEGPRVPPVPDKSPPFAP
jgi:hypothetical protein